MSRRLAIGLGFALILSACVSGLPKERGAYIKHLRSRAAQGDAAAARTLAAEIAHHGRAVGSLADARRFAARAARAGDLAGMAWAARWEEAAGASQEAVGAWTKLLTRHPTGDTRLHRYAAARLLALVDHVQLKPALLKALTPLMRRRGRLALMIAEVVEAVALRLGDGKRLAEARSKSGVVRRYRASPRLHPLPVTGLRSLSPGRDPQAPDTAGITSRFGEVRETPDGTLAFPETGPGVFAARVLIGPSKIARELACHEVEAIRVYLAGKLIGEMDGISKLQPRRFRVRIPPTRRAALEIHVASRAEAPTLRCMIRPQPAPSALRPVKTLLSRLAALEIALWRGDMVRAMTLIDLLLVRDRAAPLAVLPIVRSWRADPTLDHAQSRSWSRLQLRGALSALPGLAEARIQRIVSWVTGLILIAFAIGLITEHAI